MRSGQDSWDAPAPGTDNKRLERQNAMHDVHGTRGVHTLAEIRSQADSWEATLDRIRSAPEPYRELYSEAEEIVFTGCGSAFNVSHSAAALSQRLLGKTCRAVHASDLATCLDSFMNRGRRTLVVGYSRSGDTTETVLALRAAKDAGAPTLAIVCFEQCAMVEAADAALVLTESVEKSVTTTRSLTAMALAGTCLAGTCADDRSLLSQLATLPELGRARMREFERIGRAISDAGRVAKFAFLGGGAYYGLAREAQLKIKEMTLLPSDSYVALDYQHGPMSNADERMLVTIMASDAGRDYEVELARNMKALGANTFILCNRLSPGFAESADFSVELDTGLGDGLRDVLYMPALQFLAYYESLRVGCDPDRPKNLSYHVELERTGA